MSNKVQEKDGKENLKHKSAIPLGDLRKHPTCGSTHPSIGVKEIKKDNANFELTISVVFEIDEDGCLFALRMLTRQP